MTTGYRTKPRYRDIVCDWPDLAPDDGCEPLKATVVSNLTFSELDAIPAVLRPQENGEGIVIYADETLRSAIAPYVTNWNVTARDIKTGESVDVPPPADRYEAS